MEVYKHPKIKVLEIALLTSDDAKLHYYRGRGIFSSWEILNVLRRRTGEKQNKKQTHDGQIVEESSYSM